MMHYSTTYTKINPLQDDVRIAEAGRRNYRNIFHGVYEIRRTEGVGRFVTRDEYFSDDFKLL